MMYTATKPLPATVHGQTSQTVRRDRLGSAGFTLSERFIIEGFTLIEVLVAMFVLSIGLLGIAGLQTVSKRSSFGSVQRSTAVMLAQELVERIRVNPDQLTVYTSNGAGLTLTGSTMSAVNCTTASCDAVTLANYDLYEFEQALLGITEQASGVFTGGLASPTVCITGASAPPGAVSVAIAWRGLTALSNPTINTCGNGTGLYDDTGGDNVFRRVLVLNTYINSYT